MEDTDSGAQAQGGNGIVVESRKVTKIYASRSTQISALDEVDFAVKRGEIVAVRGSSGSGKTTLINVLSGLDSATSGEVLLGGRNILDFGDNALTTFRARHMGFIFQSFNLLPVLSALENVEFAAILAGRRASQARHMAKEKLELVGLADRMSHKPAELSGGQQQRVTVARALVNEPEIVWADEPTGNLDSTNEREIMDLIVQLNRDNNQSFVMVTHSTEVASIAHRTVTMVDGRVAS